MSHAAWAWMLLLHNTWKLHQSSIYHGMKGLSTCKSAKAALPWGMGRLGAACPVQTAKRGGGDKVKWVESGGARDQIAMQQN